jgi:hypothetical protein
MVVAFWVSGYTWLWIAALGAAIGLGTYMAAALVTVAGVVKRRTTEAAIARAFVVVLMFLAAAAGLGLLSARSFAYGGSALIAPAPPAHASLAAIGWLTLLIMGVSARTMGPITGHRSPRRWAHILSSALVSVGALALAFSQWMISAATALSASLCVAGLGIYALDVLGLVLTSTVPHRPPQAFVGAAIVWLLLACFLGLGLVAGRTGFAPAYVFVGLIGWIGQMIIAHMHHIGVRLIATIARGDNDETPPQELLHRGLSWSAFVLFQVAIGVACLALVWSRADWLAAAAIVGFAGWIAMSANLIRSVNVARS